MILPLGDFGGLQVIEISFGFNVLRLVIIGGEDGAESEVVMIKLGSEKSIEHLVIGL
jgi:hypothetical protein